LNALSYLSTEQRIKLLALLDKYSECFSEKPGLFTIIQHEINVSADCKPKRLRVNHVLENLKLLMDTRIQELLRGRDGKSQVFVL